MPRLPQLIPRAVTRTAGRLSSSAAVCTSFSKPLEFQTGRPPLPLGPQQLRIKVAAAGVNFADILQCRGQYQDKAEPPFIPGNELAGEVSEVGAGAPFAVGDRILCLSRGGAFASEQVADARACLKLPAEAAAATDLAEGAALLCNYGTAHLALTRAAVRPTDTVLVTAAAGGVGMAAVELAKAMGVARVIAACGSDAKLAAAAAKGAEAVGVNYAGMDGRAFRARLKEVAGPAGVDCVLDMVGGELLEPAVRSLNWNGRGVVIGFASGTIPKLPVNLLLLKNISLSGLFWGAHLIHDPKTILSSAEELVQLWLAGKIRPHIGARVPLSQANDAFAMIESRHSVGKVVLIP
ncbi:hypothetical protein AB1Y20_000384 [Prymnesium parvum]|uniref:Enoyl reductase (ER) domain-containing protein n=1 Tax=Prymnesium parvum TaxID=97485 RepID=A0AB34K8X8_PRYPA